MKQKLVITGAAIALVLGGAGVASAAPQAAPADDCASIGRTNIPAGDPQYRTALDRDRDGTACDDEDGGVASPATATSDDTGLHDTADGPEGHEGRWHEHEDGSWGPESDWEEHDEGHGKGDEQVSVVPEGGAPTGDGSTEDTAGWWVGGGLLAALAGAGLAFRRRLAGLAGR